MMNRSLDIRVPRIALILIASLVAAVLLGLLAVKTSDGSPDIQEPAPPSGPIVDQQTYLANKALTDAAEARDEQAYQDALQSPVPSKNLPTPVNGDSAGPIPTGILTDFSLYSGWGARYHIKNVWQGYIGGVLNGVYAGSKADDPADAVWNSPEQGVLVVLRFPTGSGSAWGAMNEYLSPTRSGQLRVTAYNGMCLTLVSTGGATYAFDVAARTWSCTANQQPPP